MIAPAAGLRDGRPLPAMPEGGTASFRQPPVAVAGVGNGGSLG